LWKEKRKEAQTEQKKIISKWTKKLKKKYKILWKGIIPKGIIPKGIILSKMA
jgi:hypothetical protein